MEISVLFEEGFEGCLDPAWLRSLALAVLAAEEADPASELGLVITGQERLRELNAAHLGEDRPTDVLAFPMLPSSPAGEAGAPDFVTPPDGAVHLGEVLVSYPQAAIQAEEHGHPVEREVAILVVHGVLHLLGYDHDVPEREQSMKARESAALGRIDEAGR